MADILVHEFISLDGVIDAPSWTFDYGFDPGMGEALAAATGRCSAILLGRTTYEMFAPAWSTRTAADDPGAPFFNDSTKYVVSRTLTEPVWRNSEIIGGYDPDRGRHLRQRQRHPRARHVGRRTGRRATSMPLPPHSRRGSPALRSGRRPHNVHAHRSAVL